MLNNEMHPLHNNYNFVILATIIGHDNALHTPLVNSGFMHLYVF